MYYKDDFGYILEALRRKNPDGEYVLYADYEPIAKRVRELEDALRDAERALFLASNEPELRYMNPDVWIARWKGKVVAFNESERVAALRK